MHAHGTYGIYKCTYYIHDVYKTHRHMACRYLTVKKEEEQWLEADMGSREALGNCCEVTTRMT